MKTVIINFKESQDLKEALRIASVKAGYANVSNFLSAIVRENQYVAKEMRKKFKKVR